MIPQHITNFCCTALLLATYTLADAYNAISFISGPTFAQQSRPKPHYAQTSYYGPKVTKPVQSNTYKELIRVYEARNLEFGFPSESERHKALCNGHYNPDSPILIDTDVYYPPEGGEAKIFVTVPRFGEGIPYSLGYLTNVMRPNGSEIQPFPNYSWHSSHGRDCNGLTSVYRTQIDECGQIWILDSGEINFVQHCAPQLIVLDIKTERVVHRYRLPEKMYKHGISRFVTPLVDIADTPPHGRCKHAFVYMADPTGLGLVVYDMVHGQSWRIENKYTFPDPDFGTHTIAGESFELLDGVFGMTVTPRGLNVRRMLFFHALANDAQVAIPLDVVNNASYWGRGINSALEHFVPLGKRGVQCGIPAMTPHGFLLCGFYEPIALVGWNIRTPYTPQNRVVLAENSETLQFVSGMKVIRNPYGKYEVWAVSNRLQKAFTGTTDYNEINFRVQMCGVDELLLGKNCRTQ